MNEETSYDCEFVIKIVGSRERCEMLLEAISEKSTASVMTEDTYGQEYFMFVEGDCHYLLQSDLKKYFEEYSDLNIEAFSRNINYELCEHYIYYNGICECSNVSGYDDSINWVNFN